MKNGNLLIVEDEQNLCEMLLEMFTPLVKKIDLATNGQEAMVILANNSNIDCVITDIKMPKVSGIELLKHSRINKIDIPFIFLTGEYASECSAEILIYNATYVMEKPFRVHKVIELVQLAYTKHGKKPFL